MEKRRVVLYGSSIIVGTVGVSLQHSPQYEVVSLLPIQQNELEAMAPDVVLFDLEAARPEAAFTLLESHPDLILVGISPDTNLVKVWSARQMCELSTQELLELIGKSGAIVENRLENDRFSKF